MSNWKPFPKQEKALQYAYFTDELLYGGARGPGKTDCGMVWLVEPIYIKNPEYRALVIRRNADDLRDWIDRAERMFARCGAKRVGKPAEFRFPSGAIIRTGHLKDSGAYTKYQGHEYQKILIEELTQIPTEDNYEKLIASNRSTIEGLRASVFATTNPDGPGHCWVKKRFHCMDESMKIYEYNDKKTGLVRKIVFIPGKVDDNPHLIKNDPKYIAFLNSIKDDVLREQWRHGSWEEFDVEGAYYTEQIRQAEREGRITQLAVNPLVPVDITFDLGYKTMRLWFFQVEGEKIRFIDYAEPAEPGLPGAKKCIQEKGYITGYYYFPHDIETGSQETGRSRLDTVRKLNMTPYIISPRVKIKDDGINAVKMLFPYFHFDAERCKDGLWGLKNHSQVYDEDNQVWRHRTQSNWASHIADSVQTMAQTFKWGRQAPTNDISRAVNLFAINARAKDESSGSVTGY